jgi:hypothetical protein
VGFWTDASASRNVWLAISTPGSSFLRSKVIQVSEIINIIGEE